MNPRKNPPYQNARIATGWHPEGLDQPPRYYITNLWDILSKTLPNGFYELAGHREELPVVESLLRDLKAWVGEDGVIRLPASASTDPWIVAWGVKDILYKAVEKTVKATARRAGGKPTWDWFREHIEATAEQRREYAERHPEVVNP